MRWSAAARTRDDPADTYRIAVERKVESRGGSRFLHDRVAVGDRLSIAPPRNDFPLHYHQADRLLIAGGIGIVPIYAMARGLVRRGIPFALHYAGPGRDEMAYCAELERLCGASAHFHYEGGRLDLDAEFAALDYPAEVYICGQRPMNQALVGTGTRKRVVASADPAGMLRSASCRRRPMRTSNSRSSCAAPASSRPCRPMPAFSRRCSPTGYQAQFYCGRGECGFCPLPVLEADGPIEHRDHFLGTEERGDHLCICVSRLKGTRLVLDA